MSRTEQQRARRVRTLAFSVVAVVLAVLAHLAGGGDVPALPVLALLAVLVDAGAGRFARRPRGPVTTALALGTSQLVLHGAFAMTTPSHHAEAGVGLPMLAWHAFATLVLAGVLSHGEELLRRLARLLAPCPVLIPPATPARPGTPRWTEVAFTGARPRGLLLGLTRRGPPAAVAART